MLCCKFSTLSVAMDSAGTKQSIPDTNFRLKWHLGNKVMSPLKTSCTIKVNHTGILLLSRCNVICSSHILKYCQPYLTRRHVLHGYTQTEQLQKWCGLALCLPVAFGETILAQGHHVHAFHNEHIVFHEKKKSVRNAIKHLSWTPNIPIFGMHF